MNELSALDNAAENGDTGSTNDGIDGGIQIADRNLFSPNASTSNGMALGFLFFFGSMFYTFATIGMIPRLRLTGELDTILRTGTPWDLILRIWRDLIFTGHLVNFVFVQIFYVFVLGMVTTLTGWTAANPGVAASRMILIIPGGFIFGGTTGPLAHFADWVVTFSHIWPLTWQFHFTRDIISCGADFMGYAATFGAFLIYIAVIGILYAMKFYRAKKELLRQASEERTHKRAKLAVEEWAIELSRAADAELTILMVIDYDAHISAFEQVSMSGYLPAELKVAAYCFLAELMHEIPCSVRAHTRVEEGDPAEVTVAVAAEEESHLIVMGSRGFGTFKRIAFGSVSTHVTRHAHCPVLLAK